MCTYTDELIDAGDVYENGTAVGVYGAIYTGDMDFRAGVYNYKPEIFDFSDNVVRSAPVLLVPAPQYVKSL